MILKIIIASFIVGLATPHDLETMIENNKTPKPRQNLTCHVCHSETHSNCDNFTSSKIYEEDFEGFPQVCGGEEDVCMVRKFAFTISNASETGQMKTFAIKRNCTRKCESGCVVMGERIRIYVCSTCCNTRLCNDGNGCDRALFIIDKYFLALIALFILVM